MFKRVLTALGIGGAKIDLILPKDRFYAGETFEGLLKVLPGSSRQEISGIYLHLITESKSDEGTQQYEIDNHSITGSFEIDGGQEAFEARIEYTIPYYAPVTTHLTRSYLITGLETMGLDPKDQDHIEILPEPRVRVIMDAFDRLGFMKGRDDFGVYNGKYQEFEYKPPGSLAGKVKEVDVIFQPTKEGVFLLTEFEKKSILLDILDLEELGESRHRLFLPNEYLKAVIPASEALIQLITKAI